MALGATLLVAVAGVLARVLRGPLTSLGQDFLDSFGRLGIVAGMLVIDTSSVPLIHEPLLMLAYTGGMSFVEIWLIAGVASMGAGIVGYGLGHLLGQTGPVRRILERSGMGPLMTQKGAWGVAGAALTPLPFAPATWLAGASGVSLTGFGAACAGRIPKVGIYLGLIALGWG